MINPKLPFRVPIKAPENDPLMKILGQFLKNNMSIQAHSMMDSRQEKEYGLAPVQYPVLSATSFSGRGKGKGR